MKRSFNLFIFVVVLCLLTIPALFADTKFKDLSDDHWASRSVYNMVRLGVTRGYPDGTFRGNEKISRYQLMVYLSNLDIAMEKMMDEKIAAAQGGVANGQSASMNKVVQELKAEIDALRADLIEDQQSRGIKTSSMAVKQKVATWDKFIVSGDYTMRASSYLVSGDVYPNDFIGQRARLTLGWVAEENGALFEIDTGFINPAVQGLAARITDNVLAVRTWAQTSTIWDGTFRVDASGGPGDFELNDYPNNGIVTRGGTVVYRPGNALKLSWLCAGFDISTGYEKRKNNVDRGMGLLGYTVSLEQWELGTVHMAFGGESYSLAGTEPTNSQRSLAELTYQPFPWLKVFGKGSWLWSHITEEFEYYSESGAWCHIDYSDTELKAQVDRVSEGFYGDTGSEEIAATNLLGYKVLPTFETVSVGADQYFLERSLFLKAYNVVSTCMLTDRDAMHLYQENMCHFEAGWNITPAAALSFIVRNAWSQLFNNANYDEIVDHLVAGQFTLAF